MPFAFRGTERFLPWNVWRTMHCLSSGIAILALVASTVAADEVGSLRQKASEGDAGALFDLAERHEKGDDVDLDLALAALLYEQAAKRGHADAFYRIGLAAAAGLGLPADGVQAVGWLTLAARESTSSAVLAVSLLEAIGDQVDDAGKTQADAFASAFAPIAGPLDDGILARLEPPTSTAEALAIDASAGSEMIAENLPTAELCSTRDLIGSDDGQKMLGFTKREPINGSSNDFELIQVTPPICDVLKELDSTGFVDPTIDLVLRNQDGAVPDVFVDGDLLVIDAAVGDPSRQVFVDYVVHDGTVVQLFPTAASPDNRMPEGSRLKIGGPNAGVYRWQVTPPFGNDLVIFYSSERPFHAERQAKLETTDDYLPYLRERLAEIAAQGNIGIDYHVMQTVAR